MNDRPSPLQFTVSAEQAGQRLDQFLAAVCADVSRSRIHTDMATGQVTVEGRNRPKGFRLKVGQVVTYEPAPRVQMKAVPQNIPLDIVYQDEHIAIVNKQADLVVHPAVGHPDGTLVNGLLHHFKDLRVGDDPLRPGIVHRLDRDTTGLLAVALTDQAHQHLSAQLHDHDMGRTYLALSWGSWPESTGRLTGDIGRHPRFRQKMAVVERGGRTAATTYEVLEDFHFVQFCRVVLETGRTHQIRVHFAYRGHPVVGDSLYGEDKRAHGIHNLDRRHADRMVRDTGRQMLHAAELRLTHPATGEEMTFSAPVPADMVRVLAGLREAD